MFDLTKKDTPFVWSLECDATFVALKAKVTEAPVLILPNERQPFQVKLDSSDFALGGVLQQLSEEDGKWHPVAFLSKSLSPVERNCEVHDKELLAVMRSLEQWRHFLEGASKPRSRSGPTTRTWNISGRPRTSTNDRPSGRSTFHASTTRCTTDRVPLWVNLMHFPNVQTLDRVEETIRGLFCSTRRFSGSMLCKQT